MEQAAQGSGHGPKCWSSVLSNTGFEFGWSCVEPRVGLNDPCGSLPTQDILQNTVLQLLTVLSNIYIYLNYLLTKLLACPL